MVNPEALKREEYLPLISPTDLPEEELRWCTVNLKEIIERDNRLEASVFDIEGKHTREILKQCKWPLSSVAGENGLADAFYPTRFKRIWVEKSKYPLFLPSQIREINPKPKGYLSELCNTNFETLKVKKGQILLTRSGTVGNCSIVGNTLDGKTMSDDIIRITCRNDLYTGYLYAFLCTKTGNALIKTNEYGAVISHIEPAHLENIPIPNPPDIIKKQIHDLVIRSYALRDKSNELLNEAETLLCQELNLPPLEKLKPHYFDPKASIRDFEVKLSSLSGRLDASYYVPIVDAIVNQLKKSAVQLTTIDDPQISKCIILPGRFARIYVKEGQGTVFFGGKQLYELDPSNKKYLSLVHHKNRIKRELLLKENMTMITCSGTIGKIALVPKHWDGWTANQHIIRVVPVSSKIAGYLYVFLASDYGRELITRFTYGSVVDEIDNRHVSQIPVPLLKNHEVQLEINRIALEANAKRSEAYYAEQEAIRIMNEKVIRSAGSPQTGATPPQRQVTADKKC